MKVIYVDLDREWRGGQNQAWLTVKGLRACGHDAYLVAVRDSPLAQRAEAEGVPVHVVGTRARRAGAVLLLRRLFAQENFDLLHANEPHALTAAWLAGAQNRVPVVVSRRVVYPLKQSALARRRYEIVQRIVAISRLVEKRVLESGVPPEKVAVVYEGVEVPNPPELEARRRARQRWGVTESERLLGCVGYLVPGKGQEVALRALSTVRAKIPGVRLLFAGDGPRRPSLEALTQQLGLQEAVIFAGFVQDMPQVYAALDIFVFPALGEGLGTSLLAAMAWGLPVLALASGGVPEYVEDGGNGLLVTQADPDLLSAGILRLLRDESLRRTLGQTARRNIEERFSAGRMVENTIRVYEDVLKSWRPS
jgi:glycosyltransferase involved in cell wall biosynthesis